MWFLVSIQHILLINWFNVLMNYVFQTPSYFQIKPTTSFASEPENPYRNQFDLMIGTLCSLSERVLCVTNIQSHSSWTLKRSIHTIYIRHTNTNAATGNILVNKRKFVWHFAYRQPHFLLKHRRHRIATPLEFFFLRVQPKLRSWKEKSTATEREHKISINF